MKKEIVIDLQYKTSEEKKEIYFVFVCECFVFSFLVYHEILFSFRLAPKILKKM